jgi:hypothetical protein
MLAEDELDLVGVLLLHERKDRVVDSVEQLLAERANVVEVKLQSMESGTGMGGQLLAREARVQCHCRRGDSWSRT